MHSRGHLNGDSRDVMTSHFIDFKTTTSIYWLHWSWLFCSSFFLVLFGSMLFLRSSYMFVNIHKPIINKYVYLRRNFSMTIHIRLLVGRLWFPKRAGSLSVMFLSEHLFRHHNSRNAQTYTHTHTHKQTHTQTLTINPYYVKELFIFSIARICAHFRIAAPNMVREVTKSSLNPQKNTHFMQHFSGNCLTKPSIPSSYSSSRFPFNQIWTIGFRKRTHET